MLKQAYKIFHDLDDTEGNDEIRGLAIYMTLSMRVMCERAKNEGVTKEKLLEAVKYLLKQNFGLREDTPPRQLRVLQQPIQKEGKGDI